MGGVHLVTLIAFLIPFCGFSQPQAPPTFQGTIVPIPNQSVRATLDQQLQTDSSNYRLFTINLEAMEDYFQSEDTTYLFTIRLNDTWKWTLDMVDYRPGSSLPDYLIRNRTVSTSLGRSLFSLVNETMLGAIQSNGHKYRFLPATDLLGSAWAGHFLAYKDPFYTYAEPVVHTTGQADIELGFEADYDLYQYYGGNANALSQIATKIAYILDDVQQFYDNKVNVLFILKAVVARTAPDNYYGSANNVISNLRVAWNTIYSCVPVDAAILFAGNLPHDGYSDFSADGFCGDVRYLPAAYVDATRLNATDGNGFDKTSLTLAHEIGHLITQRGHTEGTDCPAHIIAACGGSTNVPIMCDNPAALGLGFVFLPQCDINQINTETIEQDAECLTSWTEAPELPCSNCSFLINIEPDNQSPLNDCGDRNEITYNIEVCNYCDDQDFKITYKSPQASQTVIEIDPLFSFDSEQPEPSLAYYSTQPLPMAEGECKQFQFKAILTSTPSAQFINRVRVEPLETPYPAQEVEPKLPFLSNFFQITGTVGTQPPLKLSTLFNNNQNPLFRPENLCGNALLKGFAFSGVTEIDLDADVFTYSFQGNTIQNQYCFSNAIVKLAEDAKIIISNGTLNISNSRILGCSSLWNSIIVEPGATLIMENTFIEDGEYAIQAKPGARVEIINCTFRDNYVAFYVAEGGAALPQSIDLVQFHGNVIETQDALKAPRAGQKAYAGMLLNNATGFVVGNESEGVERNRFRNLCSGIVSVNSNLSVKNTVFEDIYPAGVHSYNGYAIYANARPNQLRSLFVQGYGKTSDPVIANCASGISANGVNATVKECNIENVVFGIASIQSRYRAIRFLDNKISSTGSGIRLIGNTPASIRVENNELNINDATGSSPGILVTENPIALANHAANHIGSNTINLYKGRAGILSYSGRYLEFYKNTINMELDDKQTAIQLEGLADALVRCNTVNNMAATTLNSRGIAAKGAFSSIFSCNYLNDTKIGLSFDGMGDQSVVRGNEFTGQAVGLQLEMNGHIGPQEHKGNRWFGSFGEFGAKHLGTTEASVLLSQFIVDPTASSGQAFTYSPTWDAVGQWFVPEDIEDDNIFKCATSNACATTSPPVNIKGGLGEMEAKLARGSFISPQFSTELTWTGRRHLYSRIAENSIPLQNHTYVNSFYTNAANSVIEQLHEAGQSIKEALTLSAGDLAALEGYADDIENYLADLRQNSEALSTDTSATGITALLADRADILTDLAETIGMADTLSADLYDELLDNIATAGTVNNSVAANAVYEVNEKDYNSLFITSIEADTFTTSQKSTLWNIANQCPLEGGDGVYHARSLYALIDPLAVYNDVTLCSGQQSFSVPAIPVSVSAAFELYPNPASDFIVLRPHGLDEEAQVIATIYDPLGREIQRAVSSGNEEFILNTIDIPSGIIWVTLSVNGVPTGTRAVAVKK